MGLTVVLPEPRGPIRRAELDSPDSMVRWRRSRTCRRSSRWPTNSVLLRILVFRNLRKVVRFLSVRGFIFGGRLLLSLLTYFNKFKIGEIAEGALWYQYQKVEVTANVLI